VFLKTNAGRGLVAAPRPPGPSWPAARCAGCGLRTGPERAGCPPAGRCLLAAPRALPRGPADTGGHLRTIAAVATGRRSTPRGGGRYRPVARTHPLVLAVSPGAMPPTTLGQQLLRLGARRPPHGKDPM